ncbi:MAG TPA: dienelactone hydrolase family protein [Sunxiuqinia sp.]|nr:dienelactone hydrolase family protein [Sunxiuqinia sp.]
MKRRIICLLAFALIGATVQAQDYALKELESSPRHNEWADVSAGDREVHCFVAYPEVAGKATVAIVIHENRGLTDWVRSFCDQLAAAGYIAIAPDLLSGFSEKFDRTSEFPNSDDARNAIYELKPDQVKDDLNAVQKYAEKISAGNGKTVSIGFCWGGSQSFRLVTYNDRLKAALVFYGSTPDENALKSIAAPVYGFYGGNDARITSRVPETKKMMEELGKTYEYQIYDGAGHAFMRRGDDPSVGDANTKARNESWERMKTILSGIE